MKIGIDASRLTEHKRTGTGNYLYEVIKALSVLDKTNTYIVYFSEKPSTQFITETFNQNPNFTHKTIKKFVSWTQFSLAYSTMTDGVELLFCSWHTVPILAAPKIKFLSVIHDMQLKTASPIFTLLTILLSSHVIAVSNCTKEDILKYVPFAKKKISVIYEGVDTVKFTKASSVAIDAVRTKYALNSKYFIYVGTIGHRKNVPTIIEAFSRLKGEGDMQLVLAGSVAEEYKSVYDIPAKYDIASRVKFLGYVPNSDLPALLSGSAGLVYVSKAEGFGLPILEAMACGVPVLTSNLSSMQEIAGDAAVLVSPDSTESIAAGMKTLLTDSTQLISKGYINIKSYTWPVCATSILKLVRLYDQR